MLVGSRGNNKQPNIVKRLFYYQQYKDGEISISRLRELCGFKTMEELREFLDSIEK